MNNISRTVPNKDLLFLFVTYDLLIIQENLHTIQRNQKLTEMTEWFLHSYTH